MGYGPSNPSASMTGTPEDFWDKMKYLEEHKCCWRCNKENSRIIDGKYCSEECKNNSPLKDYKTGMV
jgi:hypothetical protein